MLFLALFVSDISVLSPPAPPVSELRLIKIPLAWPPLTPDIKIPGRHETQPAPIRGKDSRLDKSIVTHSSLTDPHYSQEAEMAGISVLLSHYARARPGVHCNHCIPVTSE